MNGLFFPKIVNVRDLEKVFPRNVLAGLGLGLHIKQYLTSLLLGEVLNCEDWDLRAESHEKGARSHCERHHRCDAVAGARLQRQSVFMQNKTTQLGLAQ